VVHHASLGVVCSSPVAVVRHHVLQVAACTVLLALLLLDFAGIRHSRVPPLVFNFSIRIILRAFFFAIYSIFWWLLFVIVCLPRFFVDDVRGHRREQILLVFPLLLLVNLLVDVGIDLLFLYYTNLLLPDCL